jgi:hypothetical protein
MRANAAAGACDQSPAASQVVVYPNRYGKAA